MRLNREYDMIASEILQDITKGELNEKTFGKMRTLADYMGHIKFEEVDPIHIGVYYEIIGKMCVIRNLLSAPIYNYLFNNDNVYIDTDSCIKIPTIEVEQIRYGHWVNNTFCSECKRFPVDVSVPISNQELTKYFSRCPHCGARMKKEV